MKEPITRASILEAELSSLFPPFALERLSAARAETEERLRSFLNRGGNSQTEKRNRLNRATWRLIETVAWARIFQNRNPLHSPADSMSQQEQLLIDLGFIGPQPLQGRPLHLPKLEHGPEDCPVHVSWLHEHLNVIADRVLSSPKAYRIQKEIEEKQKQLPKKQNSAEKLHKRLLSFAGSLREAEKLRRLQARIDEFVPGLSMLEATTWLDAESLRQRQKLTEGVNRLRLCQQDLIHTYSERKRLADLQNSYLTAVTAQKKVEIELDVLKRKLKKVTSDAGRISPEELFQKLVQEFEALRSCLRASSKLARGVTPQVFLEKQPVWTVPKVVFALQEILETDYQMRRAWSFNRWPKPYIVVVPGTGRAYYQRLRNTIWIPSISSKEDFSSFSRELGKYHFFQDHYQQEMFAMLPRFHHLKTTLELAEAFSNAYEIYIMREAKGFRKLTTRVRNFFQKQLAKAH